MKLFGYEFIVRKAACSKGVPRHPNPPPPPPERNLTFKLYDKWTGQGREYEVISGYYSDGQYFTTNDAHIPTRLVTGWSLDQCL
jgi:hypothetical protein